MKANGFRNLRKIQLCTHMPGRQMEASMTTQEIWKGKNLQIKQQTKVMKYKTQGDFFSCIMPYT